MIKNQVAIGDFGVLFTTQNVAVRNYITFSAMTEKIKYVKKLFSLHLCILLRSVHGNFHSRDLFSPQVIGRVIHH